MSHTILVADDEEEIRELLSLYMEKERFKVLEAADGQEVLKQLSEHSVDLILLDIMMPNMNGLQALREIRKTKYIPIILLSAKGEDNDKILGLGLGADDYIAKPFNPLEVTARVGAQLRRYYKFGMATGESEDVRLLRSGDLILDKESCVVSRNGVEVPLTSMEYKMVLLLMENPGKVFTKRKIFESVWEEMYYGDDNTIMVHISKIREKLEEDPRHPVYIKTVRGIGYKWEKQVP
ncbi:sigma-54 dependent response regulator [Chlamydia abortus]|uniref:response regulator transcription factor n=1 Tax=unclassified Paenibacillus TaxID=185978 RepID=UPI000A27ABE4|nr:response regulator transcription factor [Paenibacillus sp. 32O-W]SHE11854.1 sigma-54 dependent response regulator [Chlamydia abortus]